MNEKIKKIINLAIWAPSGENCQPWRFELKDNQLDLFNMPERDQSLYSWGQRASYVAHGALLENLSIAASAENLSARIQLFPEAGDDNHVATVIFSEAQTNRDELVNFIKSRTSNRKPYKKVLLTGEEKQKLLSANQLPGQVTVSFTEDQQAKDELGFLGALNEKIIFENPTQHQFFFSHITWSPEEDRQKSIGFYIPTLELPPPAKVLFKLIRNWGFMQFMNKLKFGNVVAKGNGKINAQAAAFGGLTIRTLSKEDCVAAGRVFQRLWLTATSQGLKIQPLTGMLFLKLMVQSGSSKSLSPEHTKLVNDTYQTVSETFRASPSEFTLLMFRIGRGEEATAHSSRLPAEIEEV